MILRATGKAARPRRGAAFAVPFLMLIAGPALLGEAGLDTGPLAERTAHAQPSDPVTEVARQRYQEGVKAFDSGRFEDARAAFLQAYALKRHPAVLLNLGLSEIRSGHPEDGGNHLQQFLRENPSASPDQKTSAEKGVADAKKKSGYVVIGVDVNGAELSIDGAAVGKSPLLDPVFVKPGKHTVVATHQGKSATTNVDAKPGTAAAANLSIGGGPPVVAPVVAPVPGPGPAATTPPPAAPPPGPVGPVEPQPIASAPPVSMGPPPDQGVSERENFFSWYGRKPLAWVGTGIAGAGLIVGIIGSVAAGKASKAADVHTTEIKNYSKQDPATNFGERPPCGDPSASRGDVSGYETACDALRKDISDYNTDVAISAVGWVGFGLGVAGTVTYAMIDWFPKKKTASSGPRILAVAPVLTPNERGLGIVGSF